MSVNKQRIIWADDELEFLQPHKLFLEKRGFEVETVNSGEDAIESIKNIKEKINIKKEEEEEENVSTAPDTSQ